MKQFRWYGKSLSREFRDLIIIILSDLHFDNPYCSIKHFLRTVEFIKERDNCYAFLNGDLAESAIRTSVGDIYHQAHSPDDQMRQITDWLLPIKDSILGMTTGNHENRIANLTGVDISRYIAEKLEIPYRPEGCYSSSTLVVVTPDIRRSPLCSGRTLLMVMVAQELAVLRLLRQKG